MLQGDSKKSQILKGECNIQLGEIDDLKESEIKVQNCLENLFGDIVKLAHAHTTKEDEVGNVEEWY